MELNATNTDYKQFRGEACTTCGTKDNLTVHHKIPQSILKMYTVSTITSEDLETLCSECHEKYTTRENSIKTQMGINITPFYHIEVERLLNVIYCNRKTMKDNTKSSTLMQLSLFFKRIITLEEALVLAKENWKHWDDITKVYTFKQMSTFWKNHFAMWKKEQLMYKKMREYSEKNN
jgi:hypothetical protein